MADPKGPTKNQTKAANDMRQQFVAMEIAAKDLAKDLGYVLDSLKESSRLLDKQANLFGDMSKSSQLLEYASRKNAQIAKDVAALYDEELQTRSDLLLKQNMINTGLKSNYAQILTTYMLENNIKDLNDKKVQLFIKQLVHRQHINEQLTKSLELTESLASWQLELNEELEKYSMGWEKIKSKIKAILTDPQVLKSFIAIKGIESINDGLKETSEIFSEIRTEGFSVATAAKEVGVALTSTFSLSGASMKENAEIMKGIREQMGTLDGISTDVVVNVGKLSKTLGISAQEAGKLQGMFQSLPGSTSETATNTLEFAGALAKAAHVAPGDVMASIASSSEEVALFSKGSGQNIAVAAVAAKKLGVEFNTITKSANTLLDFESSINKQLEASVLLGREINLDKAREAALNGDLVTATKEMLHNIGGEAEYNRMNLLQRKALADSMGVSVQELSKMVKNQDQLNNLTEEQQQALSEGSMTMDEVLGNAGGVASRMWETTKGVGAAVVGLGEFKNGLKESVGFTKDLIKGFMSGGGVLGKLKGAVTGAFGGGKTPTTSDAGEGSGGLTKTMEKINPGKLLAGAAAMVVAAAAVYVFAKAAQEFSKVSWEDMGKASVGLLALVGAIGLVGALMMSGVGAIAILAGAGAMLIMASSLFVLGKAIQEIGKGFEILTPTLGMVSTLGTMVAPLLGVAAALYGIAGGLGVMAIAGVTALPAIGALIALAAVAPALVGLGTAVGNMFDGGGEQQSGEMKTLIEEVRSMKAAIQGIKGNVILDGNAVGQVVWNGTNKGPR